MELTFDGHNVAALECSPGCHTSQREKHTILVELDHGNPLLAGEAYRANGSSPHQGHGEYRVAR